nr:HlyD family efflux transporter periplasmic adaptor subunit [Planctomycetales bacterium]
HGEEVKKGAPLLRFETRKIDLALADLEADVESTKLSVQQREAALESLEKSVPESLASARRAAQEASENLARFQETDKAEMIEDVAQNLQQTQRALAYQQEELKQLEKMYQADDLTEETEEIVLLRARHRVEAYQYRLEKVEKGKERFDEVILPRYEANLQQAATQTQLALEKAEDTLPATLSETRLSLEKLETDLRRKEEKLARLRRDRDEFTVVAPADGIVYYGQAVRGKWPNATAVAKMLSFKSAVKPQQVLLTIVKKNPLLVRATIDEKKLHQVKKGDQAAIYPAAYPQRRLRGKVDRMAAIPIAPGQFEAELSVKDTAGIRAGMACKVEIVVAKRAEAILVPSSAVQLDDDGRQGQVYLVKKDGQRQQKRVRVGHSQDDQLEIVSGLRDGDQILKENPDK